MIIVAFQLVVSNVLFGAVFGWIWYRTESVPLVGWLHFWFDLVRDVAAMLIVGYASGLWMTAINGWFASGVASSFTLSTPMPLR